MPIDINQCYDQDRNKVQEIPFLLGQDLYGVDLSLLFYLGSTDQIQLQVEFLLQIDLNLILYPVEKFYEFPRIITLFATSLFIKVYNSSITFNNPYKIGTVS